MAEIRTNWQTGQTIPAKDLRNNFTALDQLVKEGGQRQGYRPPSDARYTVKITARDVVAGQFEFEEVRYSQADASYKTVPGGVTHETLGKITAEGGQVATGAGLIYIGAVVTIRPGSKIDDKGRVMWEFVPAAMEIPVYLTLAGGDDGDNTVPPTYTYDCFPESGGTAILTGASPQIGRPDRGPVSQVASRGIVAYELVGTTPTLVLRYANEGFIENTGYETAVGVEPGEGPAVAGGSGSQFNNGALKFQGSTGETEPAGVIPVYTWVEDETEIIDVEGEPTEVETGSTLIRQFILAEDLPDGGAGDGQGFESVTDGTTTVSETDGGIIEFETASGLGADEAPVEFTVTNNSPTANVTGKVSLTGKDTGTVGGGNTIFSVLVSVPDAITTGTKTIDSDNYSGRVATFFWLGTFQGTQAAWDDHSAATASSFQKIGAAETTDVTLWSQINVTFFIDAADGHKLKATVSGGGGGADRWYQITVVKGARKTAADISFP